MFYHTSGYSKTAGDKTQRPVSPLRLQSAEPSAEPSGELLSPAVGNFWMIPAGLTTGFDHWISRNKV